MRSPLLEEPVHERPGQRRLAAAGEAGEEQDQALLVGRRPVDVDDVGDLGGQVVTLAGRR